MTDSLKIKLYPDEYKIVSAPNTDGMDNCLRQPGQLDNQPLKSMLVTSFPLFNFVYRENSYCRDKVNRAAGRRACCHGFCITTKTILSWRDNSRPSTGIQPSGQIYLDEKTCIHLPGLAKTSPAPTQTATPHTTGPLGVKTLTHNKVSLRIFITG